MASSAVGQLEEVLVEVRVREFSLGGQSLTAETLASLNFEEVQSEQY